MKVSLECAPLDELLGGGVEPGSLTLVYGEAGSGKTNLCLQLARNVVLSGRKVVFIDTEGVSMERLRQICGDRFELVAKNILFSEPYSFEEQERFVDKAIRLAEANTEVGLIAVDSATMYYRLTLRDMESADRKALVTQVTHLLRAARKLGIPIVLTSQVYTDIDRGTHEPLGGHMLSHNAKTILRLQKSGPSIRTATLMKHRHLEEGRTATFRLTANGMEP